jgi:hypothetical protein
LDQGRQIQVSEPQVADEGDVMNLNRPNGLVERLGFGPRHPVQVQGYGRDPLGPATAETIRLGSQRDRRQQRRRRPDPLRGRVVDLTA